MSRVISLVNCSLISTSHFRRRSLAAAAAAVVAGLSASVALAQVTGPTGASSDGVDGLIGDGSFQMVLSAQQDPTQFGDQTTPNTSGSELDALYASVSSNGTIKIGISGNFEGNGNYVVIMLQNQLSGGAIVSTTSGPGSSNYGVAGAITGSGIYGYGTYYAPSSTPSPSVFSPGFNPNQGYVINNFAGTFYTDVHDLDNTPSGNNANPNPDAYMGSGIVEVDSNPSQSTVFSPATSNNPSIVAPGSAFGNGTLEEAMNNINVAGVTAATAATPGSNTTGDPLTATTGLSMSISSAFLNADPTEPIKIMIGLFGNSAYISNQFLPSLNAATYGGTDPGSPSPLYDARIDAANPLQDYIVIPFNTWGDVSGTFGTVANWTLPYTNEFGTLSTTAGSVPSGQDVTAAFVGATANRTVTLDTGYTLGGIIFTPSNSTAGYTLAGSNTLTLDTFGQSARILVNAGANSISGPVVQNQSLIVTTAASSSVKFSGAWTQNNASAALTLDGSGTVGLASATFNESSLTINGGTLALTSATLNLVGSGTTSTSIVNLSAGGTFTIDTHSALNIGSESMFIEYGSGPSPAGDLSFAHTARNYPAGSLQRYAQTGFAGFNWNGAGIDSSFAANDPNGLTAVGIVDENDLGIYPTDNTVADGGTGTWQGVPVTDTNNVLVRLTYYGDGNDDGVVNREDVTALSQGYSGLAGYVGWSDGDYNYDGQINKNDVSLLAQSYEFQGAPLGNAITPGQAQYLLALDPDMPAKTAAFFQAVAAGETPEPTSLALLGAASVGLLSRRRRKA